MPRARAPLSRNLGTTQAAKMLGRSPYTLYKRRKDGRPPFGWFKDSEGRILYPIAELVAFMAADGQPTPEADGEEATA